MKPSTILLAFTILAGIGCGKSDKDNGSDASEDLSAYADAVGNDPLGISELLAEANQLLRDGRESDAQKKIRLAERYYNAEPGYCTVQWAGRNSDTYLIAINPENSRVTRKDIDNDSVTILEVVDKEWPKDNLVWQKVLELRKAGLCKNSGKCIKHDKDVVGHNNPMLEFPIFGSNKRIFYVDDREEFYKSAKSVGLCI